MATVVALDVSKGKSFYVIYQEMTCLYEGEITHTKSGFKSYLLLLSVCLKCRKLCLNRQVFTLDQ
jgi:hypothetical protein